MRAFESVRYVSGLMSLLALISIALLLAYRSKLKTWITSIALLPESKRHKILIKSIERYGLSIDNLTREQKHDLVIREMEYRARRANLIIIGVIIVAAVSSAAFVFGSFKPRNPVARILSYPAEINGAIASLEVETSEEFHRNADIWLAVHPTRTTLAYFQRSKLPAGHAISEVKLGAGDKPGTYEVLLLKVPKGREYTSDTQIRMNDLQSSGIEILDKRVITRIK